MKLNYFCVFSGLQRLSMASGYEDNTWFGAVSLFKTLRKLYTPETQYFLKESKDMVEEHIILKIIIL